MKYRDQFEEKDLFQERRNKKKERKPKESKNSLNEIVLSEKDWGPYLEKGFFRARVVEVHKKYQFISPEADNRKIDTRDVWLSTIARRHLNSKRQERNPLCVGDIVLCREDNEEVLSENESEENLPKCLVEYRAPRTTKISRQDPMISPLEHVLAANMDQLVIVASYFYPEIKWRLIDRYLVLAAQQELECVLILNKKDLLKDLATDEQIKEILAVENHYKELGYKVISLQASSPSLSDKKEVKSLFKGKISLLSGHSGVGKSTLVNLLKPEIEQDVETEEILTKGRHTTSYASLIKLGIGGYIIDTPGVRSFALLETYESQDLSWGFLEFRPFLSSCKYRGCKHLEEEGCAVLEALKEKKIPAWRYESYVTLLLGVSKREGRLREK